VKREISRTAALLALVFLVACGRCGAPATRDTSADEHSIPVAPPSAAAVPVAVERTVERPSIHRVTFRFAPSKAAGIVFVEAPPRLPFSLDYLGGKGSQVSFELPYQCTCPCGRCACPPPPGPPELGDKALLQLLDSGSQVAWDGRQMQILWQEVKCPDGARGKARQGSFEPAPAGHYRASFNIGRNPSGCTPAPGGKLQLCAKVTEVDLASVEFDLPKEGELAVDVPVAAK